MRRLTVLVNSCYDTKTNNHTMFVDAKGVTQTFFQRQAKDRRESMLNQFSRTQLLLGQDGMERLYNACVAVFGIGGVGGYTVDVAEERIKEINPNAVVHTYKTFYAPQTANQFDFTQYDYIVDAIDIVTGKLELIEQAQKAGTPIISSMGAGNKMDASAFEVTDIYKTSVCPLARVMRRELKKRGIKKLKVVYSKEPPITPLDDMSISCRTYCICPPGTARKCTQRRQVPSSNAFVPAAVGLIVAGEVVKDLTAWERPL